MRLCGPSRALLLMSIWGFFSVVAGAGGGGCGGLNRPYWLGGLCALTTTRSGHKLSLGCIWSPGGCA